MSSDEIASSDIIAISENKSKRIHMQDIKEQSSMAGSGAQTFKQKDNSQIKMIAVFNAKDTHHIINYNAQDIDVAIQPVIKLTQTFKQLDYTLPNKSDDVPTSDEEETEE